MMKKLMFILLVCFMGASVQAIEDVSPPSTGPFNALTHSSGVFDFTGEATGDVYPVDCFAGTATGDGHEGSIDAAWFPGNGYFEEGAYVCDASEQIGGAFGLAIPPSGGAYITVNLLLEYEGDPEEIERGPLDWGEWFSVSGVIGTEDSLSDYQEENGTENFGTWTKLGPGLWSMEETLTLADFDGDINDILVFAWDVWDGADEELRLTGMIFDIYRHSTATNGDTGSERKTVCLSTPTISVTSASVEEDGETTDNLQVSVPYAPDGDVTITVYCPDPNYPGQPQENFNFTGTTAVDAYTGQIVLNASTLSGTIAVQAVDDSLLEGDLSYPLVLSAVTTGSDPNFSTDPSTGTAVPDVGSVTVIDNETRTLIVSEDWIELSENEPNIPNQVCVTVTGSAAPTANVYIDVNIPFADTEAGEPLNARDRGMFDTDADLDDPKALILNSGNWDTGVTICFWAIDNDTIDTLVAEWGNMGINNAMCYLVPASADPAYDTATGLGSPGASIEVEVADNECGSAESAWWPGDINLDCIVDLTDLAIFAEGWLVCTHPNPDVYPALECILWP
jgi:hypothetical protein